MNFGAEKAATYQGHWIEMLAVHEHKSLDQREQRQHARFQLNHKSPLTATAGGKIYTCFIEDMSIGGMRLRFEGEPPASKVIALDHPVAGTLCGRCAWRDGNTVGFELQVPAGDLERVLRCICLVL